MTPRILLCVTFSLLFACASKDGGTGPEACGCIDEEAHFDTYTCEVGPCGVVVVGCDVTQGIDEPGCEGVGGEFSIDEAALDCSLDRLIAGEAGWVGYDIDSNGPGRGGGFALVLAERQALTRFWDFYDLSGSDTNAGVVPLKDAAYFQGCKQLADLAERYKCFKDWNAAPPPPDCDVASFYEDL